LYICNFSIALQRVRLLMQGAPRAYCHLLADVHLAGFAPAFTLSQCDSEYARKPQDAHSLSRQIAQKPLFLYF
jgi:hypothetical protein